MRDCLWQYSNEKLAQMWGVEKARSFVEEREREKPLILEKLKNSHLEMVNAYIAQAGMAPLEQDATMEKVPEYLLVLLPEGGSYGAVGPNGAGKSCYVAARLRERACRIIQKGIDRQLGNPMMQEIEQAIRLKRFIELPITKWVYWYNEVLQRKPHQSDRNAKDAIEGWIHHLSDCSLLLILDDIGADHPTGNDWAGETLTRVIENRLQGKGPTQWTSHLDEAALVDRYGPRLYSRLLGLAPPVFLPRDLPALRAQRC
jgi:DNA replication protein DnaC